ncbi:MAG: phosphatase PAP2 family protein [Pseudomonadota bacterium]
MDKKLPDRQGFWATHLLLPLCVFAPLALLFALTDLDRQLSWSWAYDTATGGFPARHSWWAEELLHGYGKDFIWLVVLLCCAALLLSLRQAALLPWRRPLLFTIIAIGITTALIGGLKQVTQVSCPWDLQGFGGSLRYVSVFGARTAQGSVGACFPGAHAGSGFALFALYFASRDRNAKVARMGLWLALVTGTAFAIGQEARGAHFLSHDLWSAMIAWLSCLGLYLLLQPGRVPATARIVNPGAIPTR